MQIRGAAAACYRGAGKNEWEGMEGRRVFSGWTAARFCSTGGIHAILVQVYGDMGPKRNTHNAAVGRSSTLYLACRALQWRSTPPRWPWQQRQAEPGDIDPSCLLQVRVYYHAIHTHMDMDMDMDMDTAGGEHHHHLAAVGDPPSRCRLPRRGSRSGRRAGSSGSILLRSNASRGSDTPAETGHALIGLSTVSPCR